MRGHKIRMTRVVLSVNKARIPQENTIQPGLLSWSFKASGGHRFMGERPAPRRREAEGIRPEGLIRKKAREG